METTDLQNRFAPVRRRILADFAMNSQKPGSGAPPIPRRERLDPGIFEFPEADIRAGRYSDKYFVRSAEIVGTRDPPSVVAMQVFQRREAVLAGTDEVIGLLKRCLREPYGFDDLEVRSLRDGAAVSPWESVMAVTGPYAAFAHLETLYLGLLTRRTRIATNTRAVVEAAWPKPVIFFPARFDLWSVQEGDGWAARLAGAEGVSTDAQGAWWAGEGSGTVPHALIACFGGDTVAAARAMADHLPDDVPVVATVDFDNDSVSTALEVAEALGSRLWGVRLDTSSTMIDASVVGHMGSFDPRGVNAQLVRNVRGALDGAGLDRIRIVASGGFTRDKVARFEADRVPVDAYGVGSSLLAGSFDFTADVVMVDGRNVAKAGRTRRDNSRMELVT